MKHMLNCSFGYMDFGLGLDLDPLYLHNNNSNRTDFFRQFDTENG